MADVARAATAEGRRYAFTLSAGLSLVDRLAPVKQVFAAIGAGRS